MAEKLIPERGWHPMGDAPKDVMTAIVVLYHEHNKSTGPLRVQFARWLPNPYGEWAWRQAWRADAGMVWAEGFMMPEDFQRACEALVDEALEPDVASQEFDL